jgi:hypothetical protein
MFKFENMRFIIVAVIVYSLKLNAQTNASLGIYINPIFTNVAAKQGSYLYPKQPSSNAQNHPPSSIGLDYGLNALIQGKYIGIELGAEYTGKHLGIGYTETIGNTVGFNFRYVASTLEFISLLRIKLYANTHLNYKIYLVMGGSYNIYSYHRTKFTTTADSTDIAHGSSTWDNFLITHGEKNTTYKSTTFIGGVRIRADIRKFGLIEYGLTYYYDSKQMETIVLTNRRNKQEMLGKLVPWHSYLRINFIYYFLDYEKKDGKFNRERRKLFNK